LVRLTRELGLNLGETVEKTKLTPPSPLKATTTEIASNQDDVRSAFFYNAYDIMKTSPSKSKDVQDNYSTSTTSNSPEGRTTAVIAVMRGNSKNGYHRHRSNKHYLYIGQNRGQYLIHHLGVEWYLSFSCAISHRTEFARM
jgi:hypothetical protein